MHRPLLACPESRSPLNTVTAEIVSVVLLLGLPTVPATLVVSTVALWGSLRVIGV
ncbi:MULTISPECIES: hypothetical protein [unclassified Streptomyces]|uniref:hypothetical protein n=1 Tax=unclassified Streptomyces TaxID=2593676 RepID=UPI00224D7F47|nr:MULTISPECIES: hypothetical protein [unclassified Streptomyces]MCX4794728.1 hypothetical protein [Streptomyces sp. NBC_01242]WSP57674.1 hypothetical protein OG306_27300 [Streptomyces sp. NBC_01241]WSP62504.1 hypothetical protein OG466_11835 [Streptomyces sp. NBC_01240]WSU21590.1 hypothetical protein OG508_11815 [Streptomyces sp. NBC_01108]